jgi:hypothetical protein
VDSESTEVDIEYSLNSLYKKCVKEFQWSLKDIDDTNLETLLDFLLFENKPDPNTRVIGGKVYRRATPGTAPSWL